MEKVLTYILVFLMTGFVLNGQTLEISNSTIEHNEGERPCIKVIMEPSPKAVKKNWDDYLKDNHDVNLKGIGFLANKDLLSAEEVSFEALSDKKMNFYSHFKEENGITTMRVFASFGYDIYVDGTDYPKVYRTMKNITADFLREYLPDYYQEEVETVEDRVSDLQDKISDMRKTLTKNRETIEELKEENDELEATVEEEEALLEQARDRLNENREKLEEVKKKLKEIN